jgi:putative salt-induced outer membrane protein
MDRSATSALAVLALAAAPSVAAEWQGKGEVGIVFTRGNSDTETANVKLDGSHQFAAWKNTFGLAALRAADDGTRSAERYGVTWQSDYRLSERAYVFGGLRAEFDGFSGYDYQASASSGLGYRFADTPTTRFSGQAGVGYRRSRLALPVGETDREVILRGDLKLEHRLTETTNLLETLVVESGAENLFASNDLALQVRMTDRFALSLAVGLRFNSNPQPGLRQTDALTTVNLVYAF